MTDAELIAEFERLRSAYQATFLVKDTKAFHDFCFANSKRISELLRKSEQPR